MINETKLELALLTYFSEQIDPEASKLEWEESLYDVNLMRERWKELMRQFLKPYEITE